MAQCCAWLVLQQPPTSTKKKLNSAFVLLVLKFLLLSPNVENYLTFRQTLQLPKRWIIFNIQCGSSLKAKVLQCCIVNYFTRKNLCIDTWSTKQWLESSRIKILMPSVDDKLKCWIYIMWSCHECNSMLTRMATILSWVWYVTPMQGVKTSCL
jgi:hypothetical protein